MTKIDSNGNIIWNRTFIDKFPSKYPTFFYINSNNEYYFIYKYYNYDKQIYYIQINKLDEFGNLLYESPKDSLNIDSLYYYSLRFIANDDSTFILIGRTNNQKKILFRKYNYEWKLQYQNTIDSISEQDSGSVGVAYVSKTPDGNLLLSGYKDFYKIDYEGNVLYKFKTELSEDESEQLLTYNSFQMKNGNIAILGKVNFKIEPPGDSILSTLLIQFIDTNGKRLYRKYYGNSRYDVVYTMISTKDGGFAIAAKYFKYQQWDLTVSNHYLIKTDSFGNAEWEWVSGRDSIRQEIKDVIQTKDGDFLLIGNDRSPYNDFHDWRKLYFGKLKNKVTGIIDYFQKNNFYLDVYPNPFSSSFSLDFTITNPSLVIIELYDILGNNIYSKNLGLLDSGTHHTIVDMKNKLSTRIYFLLIKIGDEMINRKIINME